MFKFLKRGKKEEEDIASILDQDDLEKKKTTRKPRKKKENIKPWTRKERYLVLSVLLFTIFMSGALAVSAREWKLPGLPRIELPSLQGEKIIITKDPTYIDEGKEEMQERATQILSGVDEITKTLSGVYGVYIIDLNSDFSFGVHEDEVFKAASLIKLPVMAGMYMQAEQGEFDMDDIYSLREEDKVAGAGSLYGQPAGTGLTYRELVEYMGKESDNTAFRASVNILGEERVSGIIKEIGMTNTSEETNNTTPRDIGIFFQKLWKKRLVNTENTQEIMDALTDTVYENWLAAGITDDVVVAHKYGRELHTVNDAGIVFIDNPYVLVIVTKGVVESEADKTLPEISKFIFGKMNEDDGN